MNARLTAIEDGFRSATAPPAFEEWSHGIKRTLFMRARFPDDLREPISEAEAAEVMRLANEHFLAASYNALSLVTTVGPLVMLPQPKLYYSVKGPGALIEDAREATRLAGIDPAGFDLDLVRFETVPGFTWGGLGAVGGRGAWLQGSGLGVVVHELGHNLGLSHANFWNTVRPELPDDDRNLPFDADSLVGIDSIIGAGDDVEYGDPFDVMGSGDGSAQFSGLHKVMLGWLPAAGYETVTTSGVYRLAVHDLGLITPVPQALRVRKDAERHYWLSARGRPTSNPWLANGIELHWNNWHQAIGSAELLDTTPGSGHGKEDAPLVIGRTFVDPAAQVFVTPLTRESVRVGDRSVPAYDVAIQFGPFPTNRPPSVELEVSSLTAAIGDPISLRATAADEDGDRLVYSWDFGDYPLVADGPEASVTWTNAGDHVVRCEVSDLKGGFASSHVVVRVGLTTQLRVAGRIIDQDGRPLAGVRVHNGRYDTNAPYAPDFRWAYTDSDGRYTLTGLEPGDYEVGGELAGYLVQPMNFTRPLRLNEFTGVDVDFLARAIPRVTAERVSDGAESSAANATFRIARTGPTNETLRVFFRMTGTATPEEDYAPWAQIESQTNTIPTATTPANLTLDFGYVDLTPGLFSTNVAFRAVTDSLTEGDETIVLTLHYPVTRTIVTETETNTVSIPGWEVLLDHGQERWFQTRQHYSLGFRAEATALLRDNAAAPTATFLSLVALDPETSENDGDSVSLAILRSGRPPTQPLRIPIRLGGTATLDQDYTIDTAEVTLPVGADAARVTLRVLDDRYVEGNESIEVSLGAGSGYSISTDTATATVTVVDNDLALVGVTAVDTVLDENDTDGGARVTFQRSGDRESPLEIDYLVTGSAEPGVDYVALPGRIVIPAGQATASLIVTPLDDTLFEGDETIEFRVGDSPSYNAALPTRATLILRDDEFPKVTVEASDAAAEESGDPGEFTIRRTGPTSQPLVVRYQFRGSATHQADFVASGDRVTLPAGQSSIVVPIAPIDDSLREDDEEVALVLTPDPAYALGVPSGAAVTIVDNNDSEPAVGFALLSSSALESRTEPELSVRISGNPDEGDENAVTVAWEAIGGSATRGTDYVLTNGTLTFAWADPESDTPLINRIAFIPLQLLNDSLAEPDETVLIRLRIAATELPAEDPEQPPTLVTNGVLDVYSAHTFTILDDDQSVWTVAATTATTAEGSGTPARFTIRRTGRTNLTQGVTLQMSGLAASGTDYLPVTNQIVLLPGRTSTVVDLVPVDDPVMEFRENAVLRLTHSAGGRLGSPASAEAFIQDNDGTIEFAAARSEARESDGVALVRLLRTGDLSEAATVRFEAFAGTATAARVVEGLVTGDFFATNQIVVLPAGAAESTIELKLVDDETPESPESVQLRLSLGSNLFPLGGQNTAEVTLLDDDVLLSPGTNLVAALEGAGRLVLTLQRTGPVEEPLSLAFETDDFSALAGVDYIAVSGQLEFRAGERTATLSLPLLDDDLLEGDETFLVRFLSSEGVSVGEMEATILDDDCALQFEAFTAEADEDAGVIDLRIARVGSLVNPVSIDFTTLAGSAIEGIDYEAARGALTFAGNRYAVVTNGAGGFVLEPGEANLQIQVRILNDSNGEQDETFSVLLQNPRLAASADGTARGAVLLGGVTNLVVTVRDNESPGRLDDAFQPGLGADAAVRALTLQSDGKILVGGEFGTFDGLVLPRLARLHADGFVDKSFNPGQGFDGAVLAVQVEGSGRLFVGGTFTRVDASPRAFLARLEPDGTRSTNALPSFDAPVRALAASPTLPGEQVYVGGDFLNIGRFRIGGVARLTAAGQVDPAFDPGSGPGRSVHALLVASSSGGERILAGGTFTNWSGTGARHLVRLLADGSPDPTWLGRAQPNGAVHALVRAADGSIYLAGAFTEVDGLPRRRVARLDAEGQLDPAFDPEPGADAGVLALGVDAAGQAFLAGSFTSFQDAIVGRYARVLATGRTDPTFHRGTGADAVVNAVAIQPDGAILIGGDFTSIDGRPRRRLARLHAEEKFTDGIVEFTETAVVIAESGAELILMVRRSGAATGPATVRFQTADASATAGADYLATSGELTFAAGATNATVRVSLLDDALAEGPESFEVRLTQANGARLGRFDRVQVLLQDSEAAAGFTARILTTPEDVGAVHLMVSRSGTTASAQRVAWSASEGSATPGTDFEPVSGVAEFAPGSDEATITIRILDDSENEGPESFDVTLSSLDLALPVGTAADATVIIEDNDQAVTHYTLTLERTPGGSTTPPSGRYAAGTNVVVRALPAAGFEFARWEGSVVSANNPVNVLMDRNHVLVPRFRARDYLETFESGDFSRLPWTSGGAAGWTITDDTASAGQFSARSGSVANGARSGLLLEHESPAGGGSFDFRTASEAGWDFLEFWINGALVRRWSGANGWQNFTFDVPAGRNRFEWWFHRDRTFGESPDTVWIDNLDLPGVDDTVVPPVIAVAGAGSGCRVTVTGTPGHLHVLERSTDLIVWAPVASATPTQAVFELGDSECESLPARFYRVRLEP